MIVYLLQPGRPGRSRFFCILVIVHRLIADAKIEVELEGYRFVDCYTDLKYEIKDGTLLIDDVTDYKAGAFLLKK